MFYVMYDNKILSIASQFQIIATRAFPGKK